MLRGLSLATEINYQAKMGRKKIKFVNVGLCCRDYDWRFKI